MTYRDALNVVWEFCTDLPCDPDPEVAEALQILDDCVFRMESLDD